MKQIVKLTESDLNRIVKKVLNEQEVEVANYMFFSNLQQMKRQIEMMLDMGPEKIDEIIQNGHDWADDHITEAKVNLDQVFDFIMNETRGASTDEEPVNADMDQFSMNEAKKMKNPCWKGYRAYGLKTKNGNSNKVLGKGSERKTK